MKMKRYLIDLNFKEYIEANDESEALEKFSDMYGIKEKYLFVETEEDIKED